MKTELEIIAQKNNSELNDKQIIITELNKKIESLDRDNQFLENNNKSIENHYKNSIIKIDSLETELNNIINNNKIFNQNTHLIEIEELKVINVKLKDEIKYLKDENEFLEKQIKLIREDFNSKTVLLDTKSGYTIMIIGEQ